ncbi:cytidine deaminase [Oleomonas cavernae]|uniref:Cytidine deaminase n=2 Tax=Oleomonas cavernae TaxID=2320859 RepID=A0A418WIP3_9PROT|nr:cytidine deaminase [Oleomonas cavernae]
MSIRFRGGTTVPTKPKKTGISTPTVDSELFDCAKRACKNSYAPYSRFRVGAAVRAASGKIYTGTNVENIAYPLGTCAEAGAIAAARVAEGGNLVLVDVAVYAEAGDAQHVPCTPCGGCRQRILEFGKNVRVQFFGTDLCCHEVTSGDLLPFSFEFDSKAEQ